MINVNYPHLEDGQKVGKPSLNVLGNGDMIAIGWNGTATKAGGTYTLGIPTDRPSTNKNSDTKALKARKISIVPLSGDWTAKPTKALTGVVKALG